MTAFVPNDLPANIDTVEKLALWCGSVLNNLYPSVTAIEGVGDASRVAQSQPFEVTAVDPTQWRNIVRFSIPLNRTWQEGVDPIWTYAENLGSSTIPNNFKL